MIKGYKIRIFPTPEQEQQMWQHIGSCRWLWNYMLDLQQARYESGEKHLSCFDMNKLLTPLKNDGEHGWLCEISISSLQSICGDLSEAYTRFFKKQTKHPKFKSRKKSKPSYPLRGGVYFKDSLVTIPKLGKIAYRTNYDLPKGRGHKFSNPRISYKNNKWILSFGIECENQVPDLTEKSMGIDLGIKDLAVVSFNGEPHVFHNINKSKRVRSLERKKNKVQRAISRKYHTNGSFEKTKAIEKYENILRRIHRKLSNIRLNYVHQTTYKLISMFPCKVVIENLNVSGMMKNRHLSKAIQQQMLGEFIRQMMYKCEWNGIEFIQADRFYPSSKTCSSCGVIKSDLKLKDRTFKCECGYEIDRDYNAAINLERYATPQTRLAA